MSSPPNRVVLVNGRRSLRGVVEIDADDPGLLLGLTAFETLRTYEGRPFRLEEHLHRLAESAHFLAVPFPGHAQLERDVAAAVEALGLPQQVIRVTLTAGGRRLVRTAELPPMPPPARVVTRAYEPPEWLPGHIKHGSRAGSHTVLALAGAHEVVWVDGKGRFLEGTRSNVFAVRGEALYTPPADRRILAGVTRAALIEAARACDVPVREEPLPVEGGWSELYTSSTLRELLPVVELNGRPAAGRGPVGDRVLAAFRELVRKEEQGR